MAPTKRVKKEGSKKSKPKGGIKLGSAVKVMKDAMPQEGRLSVNAATVAIGATEACIAKIARNCKHTLEASGKKTLSHKLLILELEHNCAGSHVLQAARAVHTEGKRNRIANASVARVVKEQLGKDFRLSATTLEAFSMIAEAELTRLAAGGAAVAKAAGRKTVKERDIHTVVKVIQY